LIWVIALASPATLASEPPLPSGVLALPPPATDPIPYNGAVGIISGQVLLWNAGLFSSDPQSGNLLAVDPGSGRATAIATITGAAHRITEIEWSPDGSTLYATTGFGTSTLHTIDPTTGVVLSSVTHATGSINGLAFDATGTLLATHVAGGMGLSLSSLVTVDVATGLTTTIGVTGYNNIGGLAFNDDFSLLYGITSGGGVPSVLLTLDRATGAATPIGTTDMPGEASSLEFLPDGRLITANSDGDLYLLDAGTALSTRIGPLVGAGKLSGLSLRPGANVPPAPPASLSAALSSKSAAIKGPF
jgi:WD40 repeat protein